MSEHGLSKRSREGGDMSNDRKRQQITNIPPQVPATTPDSAKLNEVQTSPDLARRVATDLMKLRSESDVSNTLFEANISMYKDTFDDVYVAVQTRNVEAVEKLLLDTYTFPEKLKPIITTLSSKKYWEDVLVNVDKQQREAYQLKCIQDEFFKLNYKVDAVLVQRAITSRAGVLHVAEAVREHLQTHSDFDAIVEAIEMHCMKVYKQQRVLMLSTNWETLRDRD
eukprot:PhM_4_TR16817/c4_g4_i6/m.104572